jgi:tRNA U38,U39,U40 pseudouridine synthase TruA
MGLSLCRSFRARHDCCTRSYDYLLPAAILGIHPDTDPSEVEQRVTKFQSLLHLFEVLTLVLPQSIPSCYSVPGCLVLKFPLGKQVELELKVCIITTGQACLPQLYNSKTLQTFPAKALQISSK